MKYWDIKKKRKKLNTWNKIYIIFRYFELIYFFCNFFQNWFQTYCYIKLKLELYKCKSSLIFYKFSLNYIKFWTLEDCYSNKCLCYQDIDTLSFTLQMSKNIKDSQLWLIIWPPFSCSFHVFNFSWILWLLGQLCNNLDLQNYFSLIYQKLLSLSMFHQKNMVLLVQKWPCKNEFIELSNI